MLNNLNKSRVKKRQKEVFETGGVEAQSCSHHSWLQWFLCIDSLHLNFLKIYLCWECCTHLIGRKTVTSNFLSQTVCK